MSFDAYPLVIAPDRTIEVGGAHFRQQTLRSELPLQSLADVRAMIRNITRAEAAQQSALGNPPQIVQVDGRSNKPVEAVSAKTVTLYGTVLAQVAMRLVEAELAAAISASTRTHSGRLRSVTGSWQWVFIPKGKAGRPVSSGEPLPAFAQGDVLALMPRDVPYATITNRNVHGSGRLQAARRRKADTKHTTSARGFLATATAAVRRKQVFKQFSVSVQFTRRHMVPGEVMTRTQGTGHIVIRPRNRLVRVKV